MSGNGKLPEGKDLDIRNQALGEFGKKMFVESVTSIREFLKIMIPLIASLITAYFALLKFLGVEKVQDNPGISTDFLVEPAIFLLISMAVFIVGIFPIGVRLTLSNYDTIEESRNFMIGWKIGFAAVGSAFFIIAILKIILVMKEVILML